MTLTERARMYQIALEYERRFLGVGVPEEEEQELYAAKRAEFEALRDLTSPQ